MGVELERSASGIWVMRPAAPWTIDDWRERWAALGREVEAATEAFALLADATRARPPSAIERQVVAAFFREHAAALERRCAGMSVVVANPVIRAAATAVFWIAGPPMDVAFHTRVEDAEVRLRTVLRDASGA